MAKNNDPYAGWTHEDFEKEAEELRASINNSIASINDQYERGERDDMDGPLPYIEKDEG